MRKRIVYWIDTDEDWQLILKIRSFGVTHLGEATEVNPSTISRWLRGHIGMRSDWYRKIQARVKNVKIKEFHHIRGKSGEYLRPVRT